MRPLELVAVAILLSLAATSCSRLTFIKPNMKAGKYEKTSPDYAFRDRPEDIAEQTARKHIAMAGERLQKGELDSAEAEATLAIKAAPSSADGQTLMAVIEERRGHPQQAGAYYAKAAELEPARGATLNNYGAWLCGNGRAAESLSWFDRALADQAYRQPADALGNQAACALKTGRTDGVERILRDALRLEPDNAVALGAMADYQYRSAQYFDARAFSERRLAAAPATSDALLLASRIEDKLGDRTAAARYAQRLQMEFPQSGTTQSGERTSP